MTFKSTKTPENKKVDNIMAKNQISRYYEQREFLEQRDILLKDVPSQFHEFLFMTAYHYFSDNRMSFDTQENRDKILFNLKELIEVFNPAIKEYNITFFQKFGPTA